MKMRGLGDTVKMAALAGRKPPPSKGRAFFSEGRTQYTGQLGGRSGARKRKDRGRRSGVARCQRLMGVSWETAAGEVVVNPSREQQLEAGIHRLIRVEYRCGMGLVARRGSARCPAHG